MNGEDLRRKREMPLHCSRVCLKIHSRHLPESNYKTRSRAFKTVSDKEIIICFYKEENKRER